MWWGSEVSERTVGRPPMRTAGRLLVRRVERPLVRRVGRPPMRTAGSLLVRRVERLLVRRV